VDLTFSKPPACPEGEACNWTATVSLSNTEGRVYLWEKAESAGEVVPNREAQFSTARLGNFRTPDMKPRKPHWERVW